MVTKNIGGLTLNNGKVLGKLIQKDLCIQRLEIHVLLVSHASVQN